MILSMKHWQAMECPHTGEPLGVVCHECSDKFLDKADCHDFEAIKENMFLTCKICEKFVHEDYSVCPNCREVYPKGMDLSVDGNKMCLFCCYGI